MSDEEGGQDVSALVGNVWEYVLCVIPYRGHLERSLASAKLEKVLVHSFTFTFVRSVHSVC